MRARWIGVFAVACAGAGALGVLSANPTEATGPAPQRFQNLHRLIPRYDNQPFYPLGADIRVSGVAREMAYAVTPDSPAKVGDRYEAVWRSQGFAVGRRHDKNQAWVSVHEPAGGWIRSVLATRTGAHTTLVASVRRSAQVPSEPTAIVVEGCETMESTASHDAGVFTEILLLRCERTLDAVLSSYQEALGAPHSSHAADAGAHTTWQHKNRQVMLAASQVSAAPPAVLVNLTWQMRR